MGLSGNGFSGYGLWSNAEAFSKFLVDVFSDVFGDLGAAGVGRRDGFVIEFLILIRGRDGWRVFDGFDFFVCAPFGDQGFDGFEDAVGDTVQLTQDGKVGVTGWYSSRRLWMVAATRFGCITRCR